MHSGFSSQKFYSIDEATKKMEHYCAYQERCHKEVTEKLKGMNMIPEAIDQILGHLIQENFLNEERFAKAFARGKFSIKKWGANRIIRELKLRDISAYNIKSALSEINNEDYLQIFDELARKRLEQIKEKNPLKKKKKLADYLLYRGWEGHLVYEKANELIK
ncbi:regulatory protein RecX [Flagellimonas halotolerans]|uniref:Regulatory protein RecX n=1 Tax=Flagellimonas halotolerans TaxID=3112164 RepID=A0ABU6IP07_9FLAO|nr:MULTISPECIES: RecX family transcriptional regulator [unclassified Allomuricauda]MEC3964794.1 RecX family transcriptional regulator [Muricauda sp. SYSU M86414]MEC4264842.1 RecX family transcriptional regulator [Muricauda sp. SYSU M84420]